jgi:hypothetical protein
MFKRSSEYLGGPQTGNELSVLTYFAGTGGLTYQLDTDLQQSPKHQDAIDDKCSATKSTKGSFYGSWPEQKGTNTIQG